MNKRKILIIKNITREGPGLLKEILDCYEIKYDIVDVHQGEHFPDPKIYSALFVFGSPDSANDTTSKIKQELKRVQEATEAGIPCFGVCLGMQLLVKANGGKVYKHHVREVGWRDLEGDYFEVILTAAGEADPLFSGVKSPLNIFHLHSETVELTNGMQLLATGKYCGNQVVKVGENAYGIQGHLELTPGMLQEWIRQDPELLQLDYKALQVDYARIRTKYEHVGKAVFMNFLKLGGVLS